MSEIDDLRKFNRKFDLPEMLMPGHLSHEGLQERIGFIEEELTELKGASVNQDLEGISDALIDIVYVVKGTAVMLGLPWEQLWNEVQRSNMQKVRSDKPTKRLRRDVVKPAGWQPPNILQVLYDAGYRPDAWKVGDIFNEEHCYDNQTTDDS